MKKGDKYLCEAGCNEKKAKPDIKRIGRQWKCCKCLRKQRKEKRDYILHNVAGVRRRTEILEEVRIRKEERERIREEKRNFTPIVPGSIQEKRKDKASIRQGRLGSWYIFGYLTKTEKEFLYKKYTTRKENPLQPEQAWAKIKKDVAHLSEHVKKLRQKNIDEEKIGNKFKEEFAKMLEGDK